MLVRRPSGGSSSELVPRGANPLGDAEIAIAGYARITLGLNGHAIGHSQRDAVDEIGEILRPRSARSEKAMSIFNNLHGAGDENRTHVRRLGSCSQGYPLVSDDLSNELRPTSICSDSRILVASTDSRPMSAWAFFTVSRA